MTPLALALGEQPRPVVERKLFASVYKGVTDVVTKYAWPEPALWLTRGAAAIGLTPNAVTVVGLVLTFVAGWQFYIGNLGDRPGRRLADDLPRYRRRQAGPGDDDLELSSAISSTMAMT